MQRHEGRCWTTRHGIYSAVIERCPSTRLYVGYVPGLPGAHSQGETLEELNANLQEAIALLLDEADEEHVRSY